MGGWKTALGLTAGTGGAVGNKVALALLALPFITGTAAGYGYEATTNPDPRDVANTGREMELADLETDLVRTRRRTLLNELRKRKQTGSVHKAEPKREIRI